ncbi:MAG: hydrogenase iron-sulfur subunit [Thermodesulfobacteriota bacterium]
MQAFEPKIIAFCCDQSGYPSLDMAGRLRLRLPKNLEIVRIPCAGRIEMIYLLKALERGADGILIFACYEENCQFLRGNLRLRGRLSYIHRLLEKIGIEKERLEICHLATNSGQRFAEVLWQKREALIKLGPNPCKI